MMGGNPLFFFPERRFRALIDRLASCLELIKGHLCFYIGLSALFGHVLAQQAVSSASFGVGGGVFVLACGAGVLNNIQDRSYDRCFVRTCHRVMASQKVPLTHAAVLSAVLIMTGLAGIWTTGGVAASGFAVLALVCYNGLYTPLKKHTLLAIFPGTVCGMLPPLIGWTSAGRNPLSMDLMLIMAVFGLWQVPHFFALLFAHRPHCIPGRSSRAFPSFFTLFSFDELKLQVLIWTCLYSLSLFLVLLGNTINSLACSVAIAGNALGVVGVLGIFMARQKRGSHASAFLMINLSMLFFIAAGISDAALF